MFTKKGYKVVRGFYPKETMNLIKQFYKTKILNDDMPIDFENGQVAGAFNEYGGSMGDSILLQTMDIAQEVFGEELYPCYSFFRLYNHQDNLKPHTDRPSCELSGTLNIYADKEWPIYMQVYDFDKYGNDGYTSANVEKSTPLVLNQGDICFYEGTKMNHWRHRYQGDNCYQIFIHYVRKNGQYADYKFDRRKKLGEPHSGVINEQVFEY